MNADLCLAVEDADKTRHGDQFHFEPRVALEQRVHARGEEHDADAFGHTQADLAQRGDGLGDFFLRQQGDVFHGLGVLEQRMAGRGQFVTLRVLHEQCGAQALLDAFDVSGHGAVGGVEALGGRQQTATALQLEEKPQIIPIEHASFPCGTLC
ncbi:hypothetical protein D3C71_1494220 [compost metagenome]